MTKSVHVAEALDNAIQRNCTCIKSPEGLIEYECDLHKAVRDDPSLVDRLLELRKRRAELKRADRHLG